MRNNFADELTRIGAEDKRLVLLSGDIGNKLFDAFRAAHPTRFFNCGVAEQNMLGVACGMAISGLRPVAYTIAPFVTTRCLEQIRTDACYHEAPVTIVSVGAGLCYAALGPSHQACEDISFLRSIPNMTVVCPGDAWEVRAALRAAMEQDGPIYIRLGNKNEPLIHVGPIADFAIGKAIMVRDGSDLCILSTGNILPEALRAADRLAKQDVSARVFSFHTVKPLDETCLSESFDKFDYIVTLEEHSRIGGLGSAVAEWMADNAAVPKKLIRIGTPDAFFKLSGEQKFARAALGLTGPEIARRILDAVG